MSIALKILTVIGCGLFILAVYLKVTQPPGDRGLVQLVIDEVKRGNGDVLDFARLAPFEWTDLYIIGPYSTSESAERIMGQKWRYRWPYYLYSEETSVLIFTDSKKVVTTINCRRGTWLLEFGAIPRHLTRANAKFQAVVPGEGPSGIFTTIRWLGGGRL